jgi:transposase
MSATHVTDSSTMTAPALYLALELSWTTWKLAFTVGAGQKPRLRSIPARDTDALICEIRAARRRFGLPEEAPVISCYEAGRDGFWLHRYLEEIRCRFIILARKDEPTSRQEARERCTDESQVPSIVMTASRRVQLGARRGRSGYRLRGMLMDAR